MSAAARIYFMVNILTIFFYTGCKTSDILSPSSSSITWDFCMPAAGTNYGDMYTVNLMSDSVLQSDTLMPGFFHERDILIANASGTLPYIKSLQLLAANPVDNNRSSAMAYFSNVEKGLASMRTQTESILSELECELFRTRQLYIQLRNLNSKKNDRLTAEAIVIGSAANITPVFITQKSPQNILVVGSSVVSAGLSLSTLRTSVGKIKLTFLRNLLSDVWFAPAKSTDYPAGLWYILNSPKFSNTRQLSKVQLIKMRWLKFELNGSVSKDTEKLFFGTGGIFNQDELEVRVSMIAELMAEVNTVNVDLDNFEYDLNHFREKEFNYSKRTSVNP
ncbi:MAG TPA: hypothetical protein VFI33_05720 [Puia sp.]|nr:hypothetical protein [Puia sp.]